MTAGVLLLIIGFNDDIRLQRIPETALGFTLFILPFAYLYIHTSAHQNIGKSADHNITKSSDLKILDWSLLYISLMMIPVIDLFMLESFFWIWLVLLPTLAIRVIVTWEIGRRETR
jgi:hypothetical protein